VKILAFRGAEKFIGAPQARSTSPTVPSNESKPSNELVVENNESASIGYTNEKPLPNKTVLDPEKRKLAGLSPDNISIRYNPQIQIETEADVPEPEEKADRIYTAEEINEAWMGYAEELMDFNSQAASSLKVTKLVVLPENELHLIFPGSTQMEYFNEERAPLMGFMRKRGVVGLKLKMEIAQSNSVAREIVTDRARFEKMMEKNPAVKMLWERFKLVID
jgi:DNA polymerase-3 subunit gamma/tau